MHFISPLTLLTATAAILQKATATPASHAHSHSHFHAYNDRHSQAHQGTTKLPSQANYRRALSLPPSLVNLNTLDLTKLSTLDLTDPNSHALDALNEVLDQLPLSIEFWALSHTTGMVGMTLDMGLAELAEMGLVSYGSDGARGRDAKVNINVTITGLD